MRAPALNTSEHAAALCGGLFDDAALFPPGDAPMVDAVPAHRELSARFGRLVGPFVVPAARLDELAAQLHGSDPFPVALIAGAGALPAALARVVADSRLTLAAVEVSGAVDRPAAAEAVRVVEDVLPPGTPAAVELPRTAARNDVLDVFVGTGYRAKLRTGGVRADLFPGPDELAGTLAACVSRGLALKCTAGLHHAVRHTDPVTGFPHHGFLNVLLAVDALASGAPPSVAAAWLEEERPGTVATAVRTWTPARVTRARAVFTSFGTCSIAEPVHDLVALGLLPSRERTSA
jgi:nucleotide-binding universal stress UspA family protein